MMPGGSIWREEVSFSTATNLKYRTVQGEQLEAQERKGAAWITLPRLLLEQQSSLLGVQNKLLLSHCFFLISYSLKNTWWENSQLLRAEYERGMRITFLHAKEKGAVYTEMETRIGKKED